VIHEVVEGGQTKFVVCNTLGCGKTTALRKAAVNLAEQLSVIAENNMAQKRDSIDTAVIPVYVTLKNYSPQQGKIIKRLAQELKQGGILVEQPKLRESIFANMRFRYCVFLDGFDEIKQESGAEDSIQEFIDDVESNIIVFIGCRSNMISNIPYIESFNKIEILPFSPEDIYDYLGQTIDASDRFSAHAVNEADLYRLLRHPRALQAARDHLAKLEEMSYLDERNANDDSDKRPPEKDFSQVSIIDSVLRYILRVELDKRPFPGVKDADRAVETIFDKLEELALRSVTNDRQERIRLRDVDAKLFDWCHVAHILHVEQYPNGDYVRFDTELLKDFFLARRIMGMHGGQLSRRVVQLLADWM
jgi:hypothetical protein